MAIVDANVLLYAVDRASSHHEQSRSWLDASLAGAEAVGFAWIVLLAFIRVGTNPAILPNAMTADEAASQTEAWLGAPAAVIAEPSTRHAALLRGLLRDTGTAGNLVTDAHLAALAVEHGADVVSLDRDFGRFPRSATAYPADRCGSVSCRRARRSGRRLQRDSEHRAGRRSAARGTSPC